MSLSCDMGLIAGAGRGGGGGGSTRYSGVHELSTERSSLLVHNANTNRKTEQL